MKRRPHKVISVLLLAALIAGMGMACRERRLEIRNKRWEENAETVTQNSGRIFGDEPENLYARSAVLIDADSGRVLFEKEADVIRPMASTTKIMTCIIALEYLKEHPDQTVEVSDQAVSQPKVHLGMQRGEAFYLKDLLYSLMLESHNDTAVAIAEHIGGSVEGFAEKMNAKARELGCENSHFITPNGLDEEDENGLHSISAEDLATVMSYCIVESPKAEKFLEITRTNTYTFTDVSGQSSYCCQNHNSFLNMMSGALSGKTGYTGDAGYCYVGALERDGRTFVVALLGSGWPNNKNYKWEDTMKLMNYAVEHYFYEEIPIVTRLPKIQVKEGDRPESGIFEDVMVNIEVENTETSFRVLVAEEEKIHAKIKKNTVLEAPVKKGQRVGTLTYYIDDEMIKEYPIITSENISKLTYENIFVKIAKKFLIFDMMG